MWKYDFTPVGDVKKLHGDVLGEKEKYPEDLKEPDIELHVASATRRHMLNFLQAINKGTRPRWPILNRGTSLRQAASLLILRCSLQRPLSYDPVKLIITGDEEAATLLQRQYRSPWQHPFTANV